MNICILCSKKKETKLMSILIHNYSEDLFAFPLQFFLFIFEWQNICFKLCVHIRKFLVVCNPILCIRIAYNMLIFLNFIFYGATQCYKFWIFGKKDLYFHSFFFLLLLLHLMTQFPYFWKGKICSFSMFYFPVFRQKREVKNCRQIRIYRFWEPMKFTLY